MSAHNIFSFHFSLANVSTPSLSALYTNVHCILNWIITTKSKQKAFSEHFECMPTLCWVVGVHTGQENVPVLPPALQLTRESQPAKWLWCLPVVGIMQMLFSG
jgi:hypothetical protein